MKHTDIFKLWDSIGDMAADLDESATDLLRRRTTGILPDVRHDKTLIARAVYKGKYLRQKHLDAIRQQPRTSVIMAERRESIRDFIASLGGTAAMAARVGTTPNALRVAQHRGKLPSTIKFETFSAAKAAKVEFVEELFQDPLEVSHG